METLTGINVYGWALIASLSLGVFVALSSLSSGQGGWRALGVTLVPMLLGVAAVIVTLVLHWSAIIRVPSLLLASPAAMVVALLIGLLALIVVDFGVRRLIPAAVQLLGLTGVPIAARHDVAFAIVSTAMLFAIVFGLDRVSAQVGDAPGSAPVTDVAPGAEPTPAPVSTVETSTPAANSSASPDISLSIVSTALDQPVFVTHAGDDRLFVVERPGRIRILEQKGGSWTMGATFLDITSLVSDEGGEQGLLGLAFHPDYASNGLFYVTYTNLDMDVVLAEFRRDSPDRADAQSQRQVMKIREFDAYHNGGWIGFKGDYLYMAVGDGQGELDTDYYNVAQSTGRPLGKILRIDPLDPDGAGPDTYSVPMTNPLVGSGGLDEIWALGLRNPWRGSFDRVTGDLWIADVGAGSYEEVNHVGTEGGYNFGWPVTEGRHMRSQSELCTVDCHTLPIIEYSHSDGECAVIGGYVSRRAEAEIGGSYVYGDLCSGHIWHVPASYSYGDPIAPPLETAFQWALSSFGEDVEGRIYVCSLAGDIWVIDQT